MNPLRRILLSLKAPTSKPWHLVVTPDPNFATGFRVPTPDEREYAVRLDNNFNLNRYCSGNPSFDFATNDKVVLATKLQAGKPITTEWIWAVDTGRKTSDGLIVQQVLIDLLRQFPSFDLRSVQATEEAINTIESRLAEVASFKEGTHVTGY